MRNEVNGIERNGSINVVGTEFNGSGVDDPYYCRSCRVYN